MIVFRASLRELIPAFLLTFGVMSALLLLEKIYRLVTLMVERSLPVLDVLRMLFYIMPQVFAVTLPLAVVGGTFITVVRQSMDLEVISLRATGKSMWSYAAPFMVFGLLATMASASLTLWLQPLGNRNFMDLQIQLIQSRAQQSLKPGVFNYDFGDKVIRVDERLSDTEFGGIFLTDRRLAPTSSVVLAESGRIGVEDTRQDVVFRLFDGTMYMSGADPAVFRTVDFGRLNYVLGFDPSEAVEDSSASPVGGGSNWTLSTAGLVREIRRLEPGGERTHRMLELYNRMTTPLSCLAFALASVPMAMVDPRFGRTSSFLRAIVLVVAYYVVWVGFKEPVYAGNAPADVLWFPPLLIGAYGMLRMWQVNGNAHPLRRLRHRLSS